jgi:hypothetical protein
MRTVSVTVEIRGDGIDRHAFVDLLTSSIFPAGMRPGRADFDGSFIVA